MKLDKSHTGYKSIDIGEIETKLRDRHYNPLYSRHDSIKCKRKR